MEDTNLIQDFVTISQQLGADVADTQGGGGNTSIKLSSSEMLIKASGTFLKELSLDRPGVLVNFTQPRAYIHQFSRDIKSISTHENTLNRLIDENSQATLQRKASIETSMHTLIPQKYVVHTHPVYANVFTCAQEGRSTLELILQDFDWGWCEYAAPGFALASKLFTTFGDDYPSVILLQNHGLIVTSDSMQEAFKLYRGLLMALQEYIFSHTGINFSYAPLNWKNADSARVFLGKLLSPLFQYGQLARHLFPDSVVFGSDVVCNKQGQIIYSDDGYIDFSLFSARQVQIIYENLLAIHYILSIHQHLGLTTTYLSSHDVSYILGMEREKYRRSLNT